MLINSWQDTLRFFFTISGELVLLFIGVSFLVGVIQEYVSPEKIKKLLSGRAGRGNVIGALLGAATPFCSCSTIPLMVGLLNSGAPFGATMSFLVASPLLNPVILGLFWAIFGWKVVITYSILTFTLSVFAGMLWSRLGLEKYVKRVVIRGGAGGSQEKNEHVLKRAFRGAWKQFVDLLPYLLIGVLIGSLIYGMLPPDLAARMAGRDNVWAVPVAALLGIPLYIRVETMVPIGMAFLQKGVSLGVIMALIIGGAGASIPELSLMASIFKPKLLLSFICTIFIVAVISGYVINILA